MLARWIRSVGGVATLDLIRVHTLWQLAAGLLCSTTKRTNQSMFFTFFGLHDLVAFYHPVSEPEPCDPVQNTMFVLHEYM